MSIVEGIPALDAAIQRLGNWDATQHRYAERDVMVTGEDGAALLFEFEGEGLAVCLDTLTPPEYGQVERGLVEVYVDGEKTGEFDMQASANEIVVARGLKEVKHEARVVHRVRKDGGRGCRIAGFRILRGDCGELSFLINGDKNALLFDVRVVVRKDGEVVSNGLGRNWLTGEYRISGLAAGEGYSVEVRAMGWETVMREGVQVVSGKETVLGPIYMRRLLDTGREEDFRFPIMNHPVVLKAGGQFRTRVNIRNAKVREVRLVRRVGAAEISRRCEFEDDRGAAFYYYREGVVKLPGDVPEGLYDLELMTVERGRRVSRRCVQVVSEYPKDPVLVTFGHLDTWGQLQAEYLERMLEMANLIGPDMVLISNSANPAYVSGALYGLDMPFLVNFGNHVLPGQEEWFGEQVGIVDYGPDLSILNFGKLWDTDLSEARALLEARGGVKCKVINAVEANAPVESFLDRYKIRLIHDGHGPGVKVMKIGATPTIRVGKVTSDSFRVVRFKGVEPVSYTYKGDAEKGITFERDGLAPLRASYKPQNDGSMERVKARIVNELEEDMPEVRLVFVMPRGEYRVDRGRIVSEVESNDGRYVVVTVRVDVVAQSRLDVELSRKE